MGPTIHYELCWTPPNALAKTDRDIDQLVYQLYALTPEEIALVEGGIAEK
jgi:hypothetical protein